MAQLFGTKVGADTEASSANKDCGYHREAAPAVTISFFGPAWPEYLAENRNENQRSVFVAARVLQFAAGVNAGYGG
jgi:hypothetical protein